MCDGGVIRRDYELMNMYHFSADKSCGAGALGIQFTSLWRKLLNPPGDLP